MKLSVVIVLLALGLSSAMQCPSYQYDVVTGKADNRHGLLSTERHYRDILGGDDNGNAPGGQRSIDWDADIVPFKMPGDFFRFRGALFTAKDDEFRVSNPAGGHDDRFSTINSRVSERVTTFSPNRLFTPLLENAVTTTFVVANTHKAASVRGFGAMFTDVDLSGATIMTFKDRSGCVVARLSVPPQSKGLSFAGIVVKAPHGVRKDVIASVHLKLGNTAISSHRVGDVVVLDDLIYGEPKAF